MCALFEGEERETLRKPKSGNAATIEQGSREHFVEKSRDKISLETYKRKKDKEKDDGFRSKYGTPPSDIEHNDKV